MFERDNRMYYERRKAQATEQGDRATDLRIAALHYELALLYESLSVHGSKARFEIVGSAGATSSAARSLNAGRHLKLV